MARIHLIPQKREFFELYNRAAENTVAIARQLIELLESFPQRTGELAVLVKDREHEGDEITHAIVDLVNRTFVTPFDRDDMYRLAGVLDDVCDYVDEAAAKVVDYGVEEIRPAAKEQARVIEKAALKLSEAVGRLEGFRNSREQLIELRTLEDEGDAIERKAISELFTSAGGDALAVMRWKDIHESLEEALDACENAADVLKAIVVKNR